MANKNILDIGSILSDFNKEAAIKYGLFSQDDQQDQEQAEAQDTQAAEYENKEPLGDYEVAYQEICQLLDNIRQRWGNDTESNLFNMYYHRDLLYLYDRITLDMDYLSGYPDRNNEWLDKLLELKYEIRNLL